jgi:hypothetical protein
MAGDLMPRRMSCSMTIEAVENRTKTVTRRHIGTWTKLATGDHLTLIEQGMGLKPGQKQVVLAEVEIIDVRVETLLDVTQQEVEREGFPHWSVDDFREFWAAGHGYHKTGLSITGVPCRRIEWRYTDAPITDLTLTDEEYIERFGAETKEDLL